MFSGTVVIPIAMGFDPNTSLFFSGISTIIFFICTGGRVPSYLGSSGSVVSAVVAATKYNATTSTTGMNENIPVAQGGIIVLALLYAFISLLVILFGYKWVEFLMPPSTYSLIHAFISYLFVFILILLSIFFFWLSCNWWCSCRHRTSFGLFCIQSSNCDPF